MRGEASTVNGSPSKPLSKDDMYTLFDALSERLRRKRTRANIYLVGGAVMALAFDRERSWKTRLRGESKGRSVVHAETATCGATTPNT